MDVVVTVGALWRQYTVTVIVSASDHNVMEEFIYLGKHKAQNHMIVSPSVMFTNH